MKRMRGFTPGRSVPRYPRKNGARQAGGARFVGVGHGGVAVLFDLERVRPTALDGIAETVKRAHSRVASPREDELACGAHADHLVVEEIGGHADEGQVAESLAEASRGRRRKG